MVPGFLFALLNRVNSSHFPPLVRLNIFSEALNPEPLKGLKVYIKKLKCTIKRQRKTYD